MHYHADNGRFADTLFLRDIDEQRQEISYCGVNAHFQNGVAEKRIRDLQDMTRTALLHASARWPSAMSNCLWPYALRMANDSLISSPRRLDGRSAVSVFSLADVSPKLTTFHPFGCPVYALSSELAAGQGLPKWDKRARVGIYLGQSPKHARSVALVLNIKTGLVSPQFHVVFDDMFETVGKRGDSYELGWLTATHFSAKTSRRPAAPSPNRNIQNTTTTASSIPAYPTADDCGIIHEPRCVPSYRRYSARCSPGVVRASCA